MVGLKYMFLDGWDVEGEDVATLRRKEATKWLRENM